MTRKPFTLVEILVSMIVLSIFLLGLLQFHNMTQSTMSLAADRTDLYERARIAMDMMANDIACAYYSGDKNSDSKPWEASSTSFKVSTMRSEKNDEQISPVIKASYEWNSSEHALFYSSDVNSEKTELLDGVTDFDVKTQSSGGGYPLPRAVTISMELVDRTTVRRMKNNSSAAGNILNAAPKRQFRRTVVIDRGQPES